MAATITKNDVDNYT